MLLRLLRLLLVGLRSIRSSGGGGLSFSLSFTPFCGSHQHRVATAATDHVLPHSPPLILIQQPRDNSIYSDASHCQCILHYRAPLIRQRAQQNTQHHILL